MKRENVVPNVTACDLCHGTKNTQPGAKKRKRKNKL